MPSVALVAVSVLYLFAPLLSTHYIDTHERENLYIRPFEYITELRAGFWQPMVCAHAILGAGTAFPVFYPPLSYYVAAILSLALKSQILGVNTSLFLSILLCAAGAYACGWSISRRPYLAAFAAVFAVTVSYRFVNVFVRGSLAESWGAAWFTVALFGLLEIAAGRRRGYWLAVGLAGAICSHTLLVPYFTLFSVLAFLPGFVRTRNLRALFECAGYGVLGLLLSAWYTVPLFSYLPGVWASDARYMAASPDHVIQERVEFSQLLASDPASWFGSSIAGPMDTMSFSLGIGYFVILVIVLMWIFQGRRTGDQQWLTAVWQSQWSA